MSYLEGMRRLWSKSPVPKGKSTLDKILDAQLKQAEISGELIEVLERMYELLVQINETVNPKPIEEAEEDESGNEEV
jgi:hypothetical protein